MGRTKIEWARYTWNPFWGCTRVAPECKNCYAAEMGSRFGVKWGPGETRRIASDKVMRGPYGWNAAAKKAGERWRVFCGSMMDWADLEAPAGAHNVMWDTIRECRNLDWMMLTKRPENALQVLPPDWGKGWGHVWLGTSVGIQTSLWRVDELEAIPAKTRFLSCEPLIGPLELGLDERGASIHQVICGGESGHNARPMNPNWARRLRDECNRNGVPFFFKQHGEYEQCAYVEGGFKHHLFEDGVKVRHVGKKVAGRLLDGIEWNGFPEVVAA